MKAYNHKCIKICSLIKVSLLYLSIDYHHSQIMYILYFTYSTVCHPTKSSVSHCVNHSVIIVLLYNGFNINIYYIHCYKCYC